MILWEESSSYTDGSQNFIAKVSPDKVTSNEYWSRDWNLSRDFQQSLKFASDFFGYRRYENDLPAKETLFLLLDFDWVVLIVGKVPLLLLLFSIVASTVTFQTLRP